jgi:hypothetical protein
MHVQEREIAAMTPMIRPLHKTILFWVAGLATGGLYWLACLWFVSFRLAAMYSPATLATAQYMYIQVGVLPG